MMDKFFFRSFTIHAAAGVLVAGVVFIKRPVLAPEPEPPAIEVAEAPPVPPAPTPAPPPPAPPAVAAAEPAPSAPPQQAAQPPAPKPSAPIARKELERQGAAFFAGGGTYEDLPLRWSKMTPSQSQFLYSTRASIWVYSEATTCYVAKVRMSQDLALEVTPIRECSESPSHAIGGRIQARNSPFSDELEKLQQSLGDESLVLFSDHRDNIRRYIVGVVLSALQSHSRKLEDVGQVLLEGAVSAGEPVIRVVGLCDREDHCS